MPMIITQPKRITESIRCTEDIVYFVENYIKMVGIDGEDIVRFDAQKNVLRQISDNPFNIICAARQTGKSGLIIEAALWYALFHDNANVVVFTYKQDAADWMKKKASRIFGQLPKWLVPDLERFSGETLHFDNGSRLSFYTNSPSAIRGQSVQAVFIDEMSCINEAKAEDLMASIVPSLSSRGNKTKMCIMSSRGKDGNPFLRILQHAKDQQIICDNAESTIRINKMWTIGYINWWDVPGRTDKWKNEMIKLIGQDAFDQEHETGMTYVSKPSSLIADLVVTFFSMQPDGHAYPKETIFSGIEVSDEFFNDFNRIKDLPVCLKLVHHA